MIQTCVGGLSIYQIFNEYRIQKTNVHFVYKKHVSRVTLLISWHLRQIILTKNKQRSIL
mgnify:CR=1 FL=1